MSAVGAAARRWRPWLPAIAVMVGIFVLSSQSGLHVSEDVGVDRPLRITGHVLAFGTLAALLLYALASERRPRPRDVALAFGLTLLYALSDELHQSMVPDRNGRLDDVVTDAVGALIGLSVAWIVLSGRARRPAGEATPDA